MLNNSLGTLLIILLSSLFLWYIGIYLPNFIIIKFSIYRILNNNVKHSFLFFSEFEIPIDQIVSMRTNSENFSLHENPLKFQAVFPRATYLVITYSKDGKIFISKYAYTQDPKKLKMEIENLKQSV